MTQPLYFSRVRLRRDASVAALAPLLAGQAGRGGCSGHAGHHLVWSLFADDPHRERDFLWREITRGVFLILSVRRPEDRHGLFEIAEPKLFDPALTIGDRLGFSLRANPVIRRRDASGQRSAKHDVVMDALRSLPASERASRRVDAVQEHGIGWLERQGLRAGFETEYARADGYEQHRVMRNGSAPPMLFSTLDFEGVLRVRNPDSFLDSIRRGLGSAKAYGCGLLLIRRV